MTRKDYIRQTLRGLFGDEHLATKRGVTVVKAMADRVAEVYQFDSKAESEVPR